MMVHVRRLAWAAIFGLLLLPLLLQFVVAVDTASYTGAVRVISANPTTRTYTFICIANPENAHLRDWFIRPDDGINGDEPDIAAFQDRQWNEQITYTFPENTFYHIGCNIVNEQGQLARGDLHIDLRTNTQSWNPQIVPVSGSGMTTTLRCDIDSGATPVWEVLEARTGQVTPLGSAQQITFTAPRTGLYDFFCSGDGNRAPLPVEFINGRNPYFPDRFGVPLSGQACTPSTETCNQQDDDCDGQVDEGDVCPGNNTCYNSVQNIPATCTGATISSDTWNGGRTITCGTTTITAWDKTGYFEMYKQSGGNNIKICIDGACIQDNGYSRSSNFPICTQPPACTPTTEVCNQRDDDCDNQIDEGNVCAPSCIPTTEVCDGRDNNCNNQTDEGGVCTGTNTTACYARVQNVPASCVGGTIIQDTYNGCRTIVCSGGSNSIQVLACDKPTTASAEYFEMYRQAVSGAPPKVCLGNTCMQTETFLRSGHYPICIQGNSTCTPTSETCNQLDDDCDGQIDEGGVCTPICTPSSEICNGIDDDCDQQIDEGNVCGGTNTTACYSNILNIPVTCSGGTFTQDSFDGCRHLLCSSANGAMKALACDKPGTNDDPTHFEIYRQWKNGTGSFEICVGSTCITDTSHWMNNKTYPVCVGNATSPPVCTPSNGGVEICDQIDNNCNNQTDEGGVCTPTTNTTCYNSVQNIPATCSGATITSDTWNGGRSITCGTTTITAWNKAGYFEMYKQTGGSSVQLCIGQTCIKDNGYAKSANFPICVGTNGTNNTNTTGTFNIVWIEPSEGQLNTPPNFFHLNIEVPINEAQIPTTEWEVWNNAMTERVWFTRNNGSIRFHTHTPDGTFQGSRAGTSQLAFATTYKVRTRFIYSNGTISPWSSLRTFTTAAQQTGGPDPWSLAPGFQIERVATGFAMPVHIAFAPSGMYSALPDNVEPSYYVTELYGTVKVVRKDGSIGTYATDLLNFDPFGSLTGGGQMGTIGLYVDDATGDLYVGTVYVENETVKNKVIKFTSTDNGNTYSVQQTILSGLPSAPSHQIEQISKGPDGKLYIGLGDALNEQNAQSNTVLAGRIIRMNMDGTSVETYAKGLRNPFGHDWRPGTNQLFSTDNSPNTNDRLLKINQGENYLWGQGGTGYVSKAIDLLNPSPVDVEFNPGGRGFPAELNGRMYVAVAGPIYTEGPTNGKQILEYTLDAAGNIIGEREFVKYSGTGYGTPIGLDFGPDGLYFTDIYGESGAFDPPEGNVYKISPGTGGCINCGQGSFRAGINIVNWYPKYKEGTNQLEYLFECNGIAGSGSYKYDFIWGDGTTPIQFSVSNRQSHLYSRTQGPFDVTCRARDQSTGLISSATMTINPRDFVDDGVPGNDY